MTQRLLNKAELEARSAFRYQLRRFERHGEQAARERGITFAQYLLLLHVEGAPGRTWAHVNELAERLQLEHHSTVGLVSRCEAAGLVERRASEEDRRHVQVHCTRKGRAVVQAVAFTLEDELDSLLAHVAARPRRT
ncbi:MarR family winged helix-turn-helix transcriptional regulator [Ramlibacter alkalitolerans]|uniref:MarR family transcriptional regulator n=1 Tax=Ramlibacter alkalitolerans TaxID=2039631 RepID=A0ABS1JID6_9BURK|nr:helix-turn-helix domain-containing protein [Ramlibacter alkalitolerans]MBL0423984.1 MarR family transcriptional regulator [Ramlibacter alkalitolerans]